ncbi:hypothetical protein [Bacillus sp. MRMR6]|uniref:hypothetical protein n=1 Tax=Bacillus sp. MRMR6 TaxID=1928617 RepID=UPI0009535130|nr:hypothetical protein [Bacillus sp. MRMR6]OLS40000.1 hypothetical protein BTR25_10935 [Bacillus sp. MRMR6]
MAKKIILVLLCLMVVLPSVGLANQSTLTNLTDEPLGPVMEMVTVSPSEAGVGDTIVITAKIKSPYFELKKVQANLTGATDKLIDMTYNPVNDTWTGTYQVQEYDHQGKWYVSFYLHGKEYGWYRYTQQMITVVNPNEDRVQPVVNSITIEPGSVVAGEPFKVTVKVTDQTGSSR